MKNATINFLLPNAFHISKTGFYNDFQAPKVKNSDLEVFHRGFGDHGIAIGTKTLKGVPWCIVEHAMVKRVFRE